MAISLLCAQPAIAARERTAPSPANGINRSNLEPSEPQLAPPASHQRQCTDGRDRETAISFRDHATAQSDCLTRFEARLEGANSLKTSSLRY